MKSIVQNQLVFMLALTAATAIGFDAPSQDGLIVHIEADTLTLNDGDPVTAWPDSEIASGIDGSLAPVFNAPFYVEDALNGMPAVRFSRANEQQMESGSWAFPNASEGVTIFSVFQFQKPFNELRLLEVSLNGSGGNCVSPHVSELEFGVRFNNGQTAIDAAEIPMLRHTPYVGIWQHAQNARHDELYVAINDLEPVPVEVQTAQPGNTTSFSGSNFSLVVGGGKNPNGAWNPNRYDGDVAEILVYNAQLTREQKGQTLQYLRDKYYKTQAWGTYPIYAQTNVDSDVDGELSWNIARDPNNIEQINPAVVQHYLYIQKDDPNLLDVTPIVITDMEEPIAYPVTLDWDATYYWRVDQSVEVDGVPSAPEDAETITGFVNTFDTRLSIPVIEQEPSGQFVEAGQTAEFSFDVSSISALDYAWYRSADSTISPETDIFMGDAPVLEISDAQVTDEAYYYCEVTNLGGTVYTEVVRLTIKRKVAHWTLDWADYDAENNLFLDSSGEGRHATPNVAPNETLFVDGVVPAKTNEALDLGAEPQVAGLTDPWIRFSDQVSVSAWFKTNAIGETQTIAASRRSEDDDGFQNFRLQVQSGGTLVFAAPAFENLVGPVPDIDRWYHVLVTAGPDGLQMYLDGVEVAAGPGAPIPDESTPTAVGAAQLTLADGMANSLDGILDDVRVYNYALDSLDVADLYYEVTETPLCLNPNDVRLIFDVAGGGPDGTEPDCRVGLADFAVFASDWLNCGWYPQTYCP